MGIATVIIGCLPTYASGRHPGADPAGRGPGHPGPRLRRRVGRRDPDDLRARALEEEGPASRPSRRPASRSACCWPTSPSSAAPACPATGSGGFPSCSAPSSSARASTSGSRSRSRRSSRRPRKRVSSSRTRSPRSSATTGATWSAPSACGSPRPPATPSSITYVTSYLQLRQAREPAADHPGHRHRCAVVGLGATLLWGRLTDRDRSQAGLPHSALRHLIFGIPMFLMLNSGCSGRHRRHLPRLVHDLPELPRRYAGLLVLRAVHHQHPLVWRVAGLPALRRRLRLHRLLGRLALSAYGWTGPGGAVHASTA